jgi:hypothetical protein
MTRRPESFAVATPMVHSLVRHFGSSAVSFLALESGMRHWFDDPAPLGTGGCVAYAEIDGAWVAAGDPIAPPDELHRAAGRFIDAAGAAGKRACFFGAEALEGPSFDRLMLGEQPIFHATEWRRNVRRNRRMREQLRRARAKGVSVRRVEPAELERGRPLRVALGRIAMEWLEARHMAPMQFLLSLEPFVEPAEHRYFVAERQGKVVAFLSAVPIYRRKGWLVEDVIRSAAAPNGTTECLLDALFETIDWSELVTLGLAPLAGATPLWLRAIGFVAGPLYSFSGLRAFKERLRPVWWEPVWLVVPRDALSYRYVLDSLRAFAGGSIAAFGARSLARHPSGAPFALALPLIPWTALLGALVLWRYESVLGFTRGALFAWTLFDTALAVLLIRAALRPRRAAIALVAAAACFDAVLSILHVSAVGFGGSAIDGILRVMATAAPVLGSLVLGVSLVRSSHR